MKRRLTIYYLLFAMSCLLANNTDDSAELNGVVTLKKTDANNPRRVPSKSDILFILDEDIAIIRFCGDFGLGYYQLTDLSTSTVISDNIEAIYGNEVTIDISDIDGFDLDLYIEFDNGRWCHLIATE